MNELNDKLRDNEKVCSVCKKAVRELISRLKQPKMRSKIVEALLDYCEEADEDEDECKRMIYRYGPVILHKLEKFKASEMCSMIGMCEEEIAMKI
ncbi:uncharacterized protein A4U43_C03F31330 [Asparagus officinalis]|uniref:Saposin B-type domain-containing protein n=1 Tax=Asparagus officinalis TaxID=4686 RepID=A0A5P1FJ83_ASPOF|nr:uncharacterized protein A4U43_C03F31330 [Asparagus officinalis]